MNEVLRPLGGHAVFVLLVQLSLLLLVARVGAELCKRLALPAVIGELAAGIVLGPSVLGHFAPRVFTSLFPAQTAQFNLLEAVGMLGMVLLLLLTGLETDLRLLRNLGRPAFIASLMGMVVPFVFGFGLGMLVPEAYLAQPDRRILFSFFLATAMSISAMPVIARILMDLDLTRRNIGLVILSAGVVDDAAGWVILSVIAGAASSGRVHVGGLLLTLLLTAVFIAVAAFLVYPLARVTTRIAARRLRVPDTDLVLLIVITLLGAAATEWIGIHAVFGAFVVGTLYRQVPHLKQDTVHKLESFVFPVLAPIFFGLVGLKVDLWSLGDARMLGIVLAVACLGKLVGCTVGSLWGGLRLWEGLSIAVAMNARGAMGLVAATVGLSLGILNHQMFSIIVVVAIVTSFMAPVGLRLTMKKVRVNEEESRRMLAEQIKGVLDPARVRVLLPTAGGPNQMAAARLAAGLAKRSSHPVEIVRIEAPQSWFERLGRLFDAGAREVKRDGQGSTHRWLVEAGLYANLRERKHSDVAGAILEEARRGFDFVVLGASARGGGVGGQVLEEVVVGTPCHVVIVKAGKIEQPYRRLLVPFDGGVFSRVAVEFGASFAELAGGELTIAIKSEGRGRVPVRPAADSDSDVSGDGLPAVGERSSEISRSEGDAGAVAAHVLEADLDRISPVLRALGVTPRLIPIADEAGALAAEAASGRYDLVVIGAENRAVQHRLFFGRDNERLIRKADVTVAVVVPHVALLR